jgi:hypothetical protein
MINSFTNKRNSIIIAILSCVIAALIMGFLIINATTPKTYPLGDQDKLEYIGEVTYGCWVICDSNPGGDYYYATDLTLDQISTALFSHASLLEPPHISSVSIADSDVTKYSVIYTTRDNQQFNLDYYPTAQPVISNSTVLHPTTRKHLISINSEWYHTVKDSL